MSDYTAPLKKIPVAEFVQKAGYLVGGLFILYMMIATNFLPELFGCHLQLLLKNSYWAKHLVALLTIFFFVNVTTSALNWDLGIKFGFSAVLYLLFMFSQKSEYASQVGFLVVILIVYVMQLLRDQYNNQADNDKSLTADQVAAMKKKTDVMGKVQIGLFIFALVMIAVGHIAYIGKKKMELKTKFAYWKLLVGAGECSGKDKRIYTIREALSEGIRLSDSLDAVTSREDVRQREVDMLFQTPGSLDVPSGLSWDAPTKKEIAMAGERAGRALSSLGQAAKMGRLDDPENLTTALLASENTEL